MHCPNCGTRVSSEQKFCRACGLKMEKIALAVAEQLLAQPDAAAREDSIADIQARKRRVEGWLGTATLVFIAALVVSIMAVAVFGLIIGRGEVLKGIVLLLTMLVGASTLSLVIYREALKQKLTDVSSRRGSLPPSAETGKLPSGEPFEPASSVTERTTDLLTVERERGD